MLESDSNSVTIDSALLMVISLKFEEKRIISSKEIRRAESKRDRHILRYSCEACVFT